MNIAHSTLQRIENRLLLTKDPLTLVLEELQLTQINTSILNVQLTVDPCPGCGTWVYDLDGDYCIDCIIQEMETDK